MGEDEGSSSGITDVN